VARVKAAYAELGVDVQVSPFFTDMAARMAAAHLVMSRSGASTVSEIAVIGRPALLVPYPHALDHDQAANAAALAAAGGAELHPQSTLSAERIAQLIGGLMQDPDRLAAMAAAARSAGKPNAARLLADLTEAIASGKTVSDYRRTRA
ncbi:UDP-N-acetylglucosamine--N-acetylmuramyl-(pentapeptide) pyrophosphoryl-undecaprenol N-acetylglucosamine transferase, partial [Mesorhizobium sp. M2A.F.Ca.ET.046.02.1.1]